MNKQTQPPRLGDILKSEADSNSRDYIKADNVKIGEVVTYDKGAEPRSLIALSNSEHGKVLVQPHNCLIDLQNVKVSKAEVSKLKADGDKYDIRYINAPSDNGSDEEDNGSDDDGSDDEDDGSDEKSDYLGNKNSGLVWTENQKTLLNRTIKDDEVAEEQGKLTFKPKIAFKDVSNSDYLAKKVIITYSSINENDDAETYVRVQAETKHGAVSNYFSNENVFIIDDLSKNELEFTLTDSSSDYTFEIMVDNQRLDLVIDIPQPA